MIDYKALAGRIEAMARSYEYRSRIEHLRIERARCTRIIKHVNHKYLDMIEKRAKG